jgi:hypothetical protein
MINKYLKQLLAAAGLLKRAEWTHRGPLFQRSGIQLVARHLRRAGGMNNPPMNLRVALKAPAHW